MMTFFQLPRPWKCVNGWDSTLITINVCCVTFASLFHRSSAEFALRSYEQAAGDTAARPKALGPIHPEGIGPEKLRIGPKIGQQLVII